MLDVILKQPLGERFVMAALRTTDERIKQGKARVAGFPLRVPPLARSPRRLARPRGKGVPTLPRCTMPWSMSCRCSRKSSRYPAATAAT